MRYQRTQIYLEPEDHRRLIREAEDRGISLAALLRRIVSAHVSERAVPYQAKSFEAITGLFASDEPADAVLGFDKDMTKAMEPLYRKKMGISKKPAKRASKGARPR